MSRVLLTVICSVVVFSMALATGCGDEYTVLAPSENASFLDNVALFPYELVEIPDEELWDTGYYILDTTSYVQDSEGVILVEAAEDSRLYYHPVQMSNWGLALHDNWKTTGNAGFLQLAIKHADRIIEEAVYIDGVMYLLYNFDFRLHQLSDPIDFLPAPWYSGMAQGRAMALFVRLYKELGDEKYLQACHDMFPSFLRIRGEYEMFTAEVDPANFYWIEEYPRSVPTQVLNGFVYSLYGLYEYYMLTRDETVLRVIQASITTLRQYVHKYRVPGEISLYCLTHRHQIPVYHWRHVFQIRNLFRMTRDQYFESMAELFTDDIVNQ